MMYSDYELDDKTLSIKTHSIKGSNKLTHVTLFNSVGAFNINATQIDETIEILNEIKDRYKLNIVGKVVV